AALAAEALEGLGDPGRDARHGPRRRAQHRVDGANARVERVGRIHRAVGDVPDLLQLVVDVVDRGRCLAQHRHDLAHRLLEAGVCGAEQAAQAHERVRDPDPGQDQEDRERDAPGIRSVHRRPYYPAITPPPTITSPSYRTAA